MVTVEGRRCGRWGVFPVWNGSLRAHTVQVQATCHSFFILHYFLLLLLFHVLCFIPYFLTLSPCIWFHTAYSLNRDAATTALQSKGRRSHGIEFLPNTALCSRDQKRSSSGILIRSKNPFEQGLLKSRTFRFAQTSEFLFLCLFCAPPVWAPSELLTAVSRVSLLASWTYCVHG